MIRGDRSGILQLDLEGGASQLRRSRIARALKAVPLFSGLPRDDLMTLAQRFALRQYGDGALVVTAGTRGDSFHIVLEGKATVEPLAGPPHELGAGDYFGELAVFDGAPRSATVVADGVLTTAMLVGGAMRRLLRDEPVIAVGLLPGLVAVVRDLQKAAGHGERPAAGGRTLTVLDAGPGVPAAADGRSVADWQDVLRMAPLFAALPESHLRRVLRQFTVRTCAPDTTIVRRGARGESFYIVLDGRVRVEAADGAMSELGAGTGLGELALIDGAPRSATLIAVGEVTVGALRRDAFARLLRNEPRVGPPLIAALMKLIRALQAEAGEATVASA